MLVLLGLLELLGLLGLLGGVRDAPAFSWCPSLEALYTNTKSNPSFKKKLSQTLAFKKKLSQTR